MAHKELKFSKDARRSLQRGVDILGEAGRSVEEHGLSADEHERQLRARQFHCQRGEEALEFRRLTDAH